MGSMFSLFLACAVGQQVVDATQVASIRIEPAEAALITRTGAAASQTFFAYATFDDGHEEPIDLVAWDSSNVAAGTVDFGGLFTAADTNGGETTVTATHAGIAASANVRVTYAAEILDGVDETVVAAFAAVTPTVDETLTLTYPADGVTVPRNLDDLVFLWASTIGESRVSRLHFRSDSTDISAYVSRSTWTASTELWSTIAAANRHGEVTVQVETGSWDGTTLSDVRQGPAIDVTVNRFDATGSVLYWDSSARGILRIPFGETTPTRYWPTTSDGTCVGCHSLAEGADRMVVTHDGVNGVFTIVDVSDPSAPVAQVTPNDANRMTFKALSPDGTRMVGVLRGDLVLYDLTTGARVASVPMGTDRFTHPDWSPEGDRIVMVRITGSMNSDMGFQGGELVQVSYDGGTFGSPQLLVAKEPGFNVYYPTYSPDGKWIAYNRSTGDSYADEDAALWLVNIDGSVNVELTAANGGANNQNSYPRWGPLPDDDVLWLAFSSDRGYAPADGGVPQIWVAAIDPTLAMTGEDPSRPPFWLPGQDTRSDNHLPVWWDQ